MTRISSRSNFHRLLSSLLLLSFVASPLALVAFPHEAHAAAIIEQSTGKQSAADVNTDSGNFGSLPSAGNTIVVLIAGWEIGGFGMTQVTDNQGNTYSLAEESGLGNLSTASIFYTENIGNPSGTFTITVDPDASSGNYIEWVAVEVSGLETSSSLDVHTSNTGSVGTTASVGPTGSTAQAEEIVFAATSISRGDTNVNVGVATTGYTELAVNQDANSTIGFEAAYKTVSSIGTQSASWSHDSDGTSGWGAAIATFKVAGGGGGALDAPTNLTTTSATGRVDLSWTAPTSTTAFDTYGIWRATSPFTATTSATLIASIATTSTSYSDTSAARGTVYFYRVTATNSTATSSLSNQRASGSNSGRIIRLGGMRLH